MYRYIYIIFILAGLTFVSCKSTKTTIDSNRKDKKEQKQSEVKGVDNTAVFFEANKQKLLGNEDDAAKLFQKCLSMDPNDAASMFELAKINLNKNNPEAALELSGEAAELEPDNEYYQMLYGSLLMAFEKYSEAAKVYKLLVGSNPFNLDYYNKLAIAYLYDGKMDDAIEVYDDLEEKIGVTEEFSIKKQSIYLQGKKVNKAVAEIEKLIEHYPDESRYYAILAEMCLTNDMDEKAHAAYQKIVEIDPGNPYIHVSLADYYRKRGQEDKAYEELKLGFANPS